MTQPPTTAVGEGAPPAQPEPAPTRAPVQGDRFRQQFFRNVDDTTWTAIEPHMANVNRYVTQLQQRYAPLKSYTPEQVQGLANFASRFDSDPRGMWEHLTRDLQARGVIDAELDIDHLVALASGQNPEQEEATMEGQYEGIPEWAQALQQSVEELREGRDQEQRTARERAQDAALKKQMGMMREQLKQQGVAEALLTDQRILAALIAHQGNTQQAIEAETAYRNETLKGFTQQAEERKPADLEAPSGLPVKTSGKLPPRDGFEATRGAAEQFVAASNRANAQ